MITEKTTSFTDEKTVDYGMEVGKGRRGGNSAERCSIE